VRIYVRRHKRVTVTGRTVTVRAHERAGDDGTRPVPEWSRPAHASDLPAQPPPRAAGIWDDDAEPDTQGIWAEDGEDMSPAFAVMVAQNPELDGERFRRLKALRDSGYTGPVDQDGNAIPEALPDAMAEYRAARTELQAIAERDEAAGVDWETDEFLEANARVRRAEQNIPRWRR
jgi:hypothetical protein